MFIAALFTKAKLWQQPRCPTTDKWIKKMWYLYTIEFYSATKENKILSFAGKLINIYQLYIYKMSFYFQQKSRNMPIKNLEYKAMTD
jgi:hypothetical protein